MATQLPITLPLIKGLGDGTLVVHMYIFPVPGPFGDPWIFPKKKSGGH
jgi:hypothetical protein